jgi:hypothetical protein
LAKAGLIPQAIAIAKEAAPYFNAKLASETHRILNDDSKREPEEIRREIAELDRLAAASAQAGDLASGMPGEPNGVVH